MSIRTIKECQELAAADYLRMVGRVIFPRWVYGFVGDSYIQAEVFTAGGYPFLVELTPNTDVTAISGCGWVDPCWDIEPLDPENLPPELQGCRPTLWTHGRSYNIDGSTSREEFHFTDTIRP